MLGSHLSVLHIWWSSNFHFSLLSTLTHGSQHKQTHQGLTSFGLNLVRSFHKVHIGPKNEVQAKCLQDSPSLNVDRPALVFSCLSVVLRDTPAEVKDGCPTFL